MPTPEDTPPKTNVEISELLGLGRFDEAFEHLPTLESRFEHEGIVDSTVARLLASMLVLPRVDTDRVCEIWEPCLSGTPPTPDNARLEQLRGRLGDDFLYGLVLAELGNLMYRIFQPPIGWEISQQALTLIASAHSNHLDPIHAHQSRLLARVWDARVSWQNKRRDLAKERIETALREIRKAQRAHEYTPGLDLAEAIALDVMSDFDAIQGKTAPALEHIREAMVLVASARDQTRVAHIHYLYGKIVAPQLEDESEPIRLFRQAAHLYPDGHPFRYRALNQEIQVLARVEFLDEAEGLLRGVNQTLSEDRQISPTQRDYCMRELALSGCWILERQAKQVDAKWKQCLEYAESIQGSHDWKCHPPRHGAELRLHLGRALSHNGNAEKAVSELKDGLDLVQNASVKIALYFALAQAYIRMDEDSKARSSWRDGHALRTDGVPSRFLREWDEQLAQRIGDIAIEMDQPFKKALRSFERQYLDHHLFKAASRDQFLENTEWARESAKGALNRHALWDDFNKLPLHTPVED